MQDDGFTERLKKLAGMIPGFKKQYAERMMQQRVKRNGKLPSAAIPCAICGKKYGSPFFAKRSEGIITEPKHKPYCPECQKKLDENWCAILTFDGKQLQWFDASNATEQFKGQVVVVGDKEFEAIKQHYEKP